MIKVDEKFSYSKLDTFCNCGFSYFLKYVENHNTFNSNVAVEVGSLTHETEEAIANALKNKQEIDYKTLISNYVEKMKEIHNRYPDDFELPDKTDRTYAEKANYYLNEGIFKLEQFMKNHPTYEIVGIEQAFDFIYENKYRFHGFIDRVFKDIATNKYIIQDIKTYAKPLDKTKLTTPLQMYIYSIAATKIWGIDFEDIECEYYMPFITNERGEAGLTQKAGTNGFIERGRKKLNDIFNKIETDKFEPAPSPLCAFCPFSITNKNANEDERMLCPYHSNWTREYKDFSSEYEWCGLDQHNVILESYKLKHVGDKK